MFSGEMYRYLTLLVFIALTGSAYGQVGGLAGAVTDATTGRELVGVTVILKPGIKEDITDVEGRFLFNNLQPGIYSLELREINHKTTIIPILRVTANEISVVKLTMYDSVKALSGIIITAKKPRAENNAGVAMERKSSPNIMDGISQESIKRTPDRNTAEAMRRVSGITILDNKYPVVRGLSDRYNMALLNGVPMPSTLPDRKTFAFDAIPAGLLDNLLVIKSALPDQPAEFAGAILLINTRDIPDESVQTLSLGFGGFSNSIGQKGKWQTNDAPDYFGLGAWGRQLPTGISTTGNYMSNLTKAERTEFSKKFTNDWGLKESTILPGIQFQYSNSSRFRFAKKEAGSLFALSYSRMSRLNSIERKEFNTNGITRDFKDMQYTDNVLIGGMFNFSVKINRKNKITFRNFINNNATEENNVREGTNLESGTFQKAYSMNYLQNYYIGTQLAGDHFFPKSGLKLKWDAGLQKVMRNTPDYRRLLYTQNTGVPGDELKAAVGPQSNFGNAGKMFMDMHENIKFFGYSFLKSYYKDNFKSDLKFGGFHQFKNREFNTRLFSVVENPDIDESLKLLSPDKIFAPDNMSSTGFRYDEIADPFYHYTGTQNLNAGYVMTDNIIDRVFRITGGVRVEKFMQQLVTKNKQDSTIKPTIDNLNILPSGAFTIMVTNKTNLRLSYARTVSRPDFREISPFSYFDFVNYISVTGNDKLTSGQINNFDLRYETFPGDGQSFSVGAFYKKFLRPIEQIVSTVVQDGNRSIQFQNAPSAIAYGAEAEFRLKLKKLMRKLKNWEISGNLAYINSEVQLKDSVSGTKTRPLQGQSPYIANLGLFYNGRSSGWSFAINYNLIGPRIYSVGTANYPDFYDKNRHVLDVQVAKSLNNRSEIKLSVGDILAQDYVLYQNMDAKTAYSTSDHVVNRMKTAPFFLLNFVFRLK